MPIEDKDIIVELKVPVYIPEFKSWCLTRELYSEGCAIESALFICQGMTINLIFDLPVIGPLHLVADVSQKVSEDKKNLIKLDFNKNYLEFENSLKIYYFFLKNQIKLYDIKKLFEDLQKKNQITTYKIPNYSLIIREND